MKKNWFLRIGLIALVLAVATTCLVGGTFAKYTTTVYGTDTIQVARFGFAATDGTKDLSITSPTDINLFENAKAAVAGTVATGTGGLMFAPGVSGTFAIVLDNSASDVDIIVDSVITASILSDGDAFTSDVFNLDTKFIKFAISEDAFGEDIDYSVVASLSELATAIQTRATLFEVSKSASRTIFIAYIWEGATDDADTDIGYAVEASANPVEIKLNIAITAAQKI